MTAGTQYQHSPVEGGAFLWQRRQQVSPADVSKRFDLYLLMRWATLTTFVLLFGDNTCDRKATLNTRLWARAGTLSPCEASAGGNNGKHSDFVIITTCRRRSSCWHPDSNTITVIKEKDWEHPSLETLRWQTQPVSFSLFTLFKPFFLSKIWHSLLFFLPLSRFPSCFLLSGTETNQSGSGSTSQKNVAECFMNVLLTLWQLLIWWCMALKHVHWVICNDTCCWPGS